MHTMPKHEYKNYLIVVNTGAREGAYYDAFSVHQGDLADNLGTPIPIATVHQRSLTIAAPFPTKDAAENSAMALAHEWIDAQEN